MKANQKFRDSEDAVSPVIAVILMVAITVVLSATVYVWVSGFGGNHNQPAHAITMISDAPLADDGEKSFTITASSSDLRFEDLRFTLDGAELTRETDCTPTNGSMFSACRGTAVLGGDDLVKAGDSIILELTAADKGKVLRILDIEANAILYTVNIG